MREFTQEQRNTIVRMYRHGTTCGGMARIMQCNTNIVSRVLQEEGVEIRRSGDPPYMPTPEEIKSGVEEIQADWDDAERERHAGYAAPVHWMPPIVTSPETTHERMGRCPS